MTMSMPLTARTLRPIMAVLLRNYSQILPLFLRQNTPNPQQHARVGLLKIRARLRDRVNLLQNLSFIRMIGFDHGPHRGFIFLKLGLQIRQPLSMLHENVVHLLLLRILQPNFIRELWIVPPAPMPLVKRMLYGRS